MLAIQTHIPKYSHTLLYHVLQIFHFLQIEGLWQTSPSKSIGTIFPTAFAHLIFLCHSVVILTTVWEIVKDITAVLPIMGSQTVRHDLPTEQQRQHISVKN